MRELSAVLTIELIRKARNSEILLGIQNLLLEYNRRSEGRAVPKEVMRWIEEEIEDLSFLKDMALSLERSLDLAEEDFRSYISSTFSKEEEENEGEKERDE